MKGIAFAVLCVALVGCFEEPAIDLHGAADASGAGGAVLCVPGEQGACACPGGQLGAQACLADGSGYGPCGCPDAGGSGAGGAGGSAGSGATSGAPGAGGGVAGAGGAAGASGGASGSPGGAGGSGGSAGSEPADAGPLSCDKAACDQLHGVAHWICKGGACEGCGTQSYADCDGNPTNSCETYIGASPNCGKCGKLCAPGYSCTSCGGGGCFYCFKP